MEDREDSAEDSAQIFSPKADRAVRAALVGVPALVVFGVSGLWVHLHSDNAQFLFHAPPQPVLFSHRHHAGELGIDCRYCHESADVSPFAGMPATETCMTCHSQIFTDSPLLQPVIESFRRKAPLEWRRVYDLPDFTYFDHSAHVRGGVSCSACHGEVEEMALTFRAVPLTMQTCLDCHHASAGPRPGLTDCYTCHR